MFPNCRWKNFLTEVYSKDKDFYAYDIIDLLRKNVKPIADFISGNKSLMVLDH